MTKREATEAATRYAKENERGYYVLELQAGQYFVIDSENYEEGKIHFEAFPGLIGTVTRYPP